MGIARAVEKREARDVTRQATINVARDPSSISSVVPDPSRR
jgi:hypothetical protein